MKRIAVVAAFLLFPVALFGQWLDYPTPGIPRTADGKPDLSGLWQPEQNPYRFNIVQDPINEDIFSPAAQKIFQDRVKDFRRADPVTNCLPTGPSEVFNVMFRIMQTPALATILYESGTGRYRQIYMDGRKLPDDPLPTWLGYSIGRWDGDTLIVETAGFNDRTWLDRSGHPHSEKLRVTEKFHRVDFGHMQFQITYEDLEMLTRPLSISIMMNYAPDTDMLENVCNESNVDKVHMVGSEEAGIPLSPDVLAKYVGRYEFREGSKNVAAFVGQNQNVTLVNGRLYINSLPLIPKSETVFDSSGAAARFQLDASGNVTRLILSQPEGDGIYIPKR